MCLESECYLWYRCDIMVLEFSRAYQSDDSSETLTLSDTEALLPAAGWQFTPHNLKLTSPKQTRSGKACPRIATISYLVVLMRFKLASPSPGLFAVRMFIKLWIL